jgi:hypothetical protein
MMGSKKILEQSDKDGHEGKGALFHPMDES